MPNNQHVHKRECLWCKSLITGRSDKKFCNTSCKSHHKRAVITPFSEILPALPPLTAHPMIIAQALFAHNSGHVLMFWFGEDELDENGKPVEDAITDGQRSEEYEHYQKVRLYQERMDSWHAQYADIMESYLDNTYDTPIIELLDSYLESVAQAINAYGQHPGLNTPGHIAHYRLSNLYLVYHHIQSQRRNLAARLARGEGGYIRCIGGYLLDRHQFYMWGNLLGIE